MKMQFKIILAFFCAFATKNSQSYCILPDGGEEVTMPTTQNSETEKDAMDIEVKYVDSQPQGLSMIAVENSPCKYYEAGIDLSEDADKVAYLYDADTNDCYAVNETYNKGPCGDNMKFYTRPDNIKYGVCDCDQDVPTIFEETKGTCHLLFQQDICKPGQWLVVENGTKVCKMDECIGFRNKTLRKTETLVYFNSTCVKLGDQCDSGKAVKLSSDYQPNCDYLVLFSISSFGSGLTIPTLSCAKGTRWSSLTDSCRKPISFTFS